MKKLSPNPLYVLLLFTAIISSCYKDKVTVPDFDVNIADTALKVGQPITFIFSGNPDYLTFYSGETGHIYANRNRTSEAGIAQSLKFTSAVSGGSQPNNLLVMASTDFDGIYTPADIAKATWTDITSRATLSTGAALSSGAISLNDFAQQAKPFYLGFYYYAPQTTLQPRNWTISATSITNTLADGTVSTILADFPSAGFKNVNVQDTSHNWAISPTSMLITGGGIGEPLTEAWAISVPINLNTVSAPDFGVGIKSIDALLPSYSYTYAKAGTYTVTFLAANTDVNDSKAVVKQIVINVTN
jgi:hypothetical protein